MAKKNVRKFKNILIPTDFAEATESAFDNALMVARQFDAKLHLVHIINTKEEAAGFYVPHLSFDKLDREFMVAAEDMIKKFCAKRLKSYKGCVTAVLKGEPYRQIIKYAKDEAIDVIVMATYGKSRVDRFIFGSTTERVIRKAPCPVLVVPPAS